MARILWVACAEPGSLYPAVPLALELARRGHEITVLCEPASRPMFEGLGLAFRPCRALTRHLHTFNRDEHADRRAALGAWYAGCVRSLYEDTSNELRREDYDAALIDPLEPGADFAAEAAGVPFISYVHWRMRETGLDTWFWFRIWDRMSSGAASFVDWWNAQRALVGLGPEPRPPEQHVWYRTSPDLTLILGLPELAADDVLLPPSALRVGPTNWDPPLEQPLPDWVETLGRERPAMLAAISTVGDGDGELVRGVAAVARTENVDVVLTAADSSEVPSLPSNVRVTPFIPHGVLLPRLSAVVSHAGNGIVTRAACAGVPLLLIPGGKDQPEVARGAAAAGIAIVLERERADAERTREAIRTLLGQTRYRLRAQEVARRAKAYDAASVAADATERLLSRNVRRRNARSRFRRATRPCQLRTAGQSEPRHENPAQAELFIAGAGFEPATSGL
jgi:UDP:flavonoid glycosyltransferase YjiC (YdhE family)